MQDNVIMTLNKGERTITYTGVVCESISEASALLHPDYWKNIPVGMKMLLDNGTKILIRLNENTMLIRVNGSRHFVQMQK